MRKTTQKTTGKHEKPMTFGERSLNDLNELVRQIFHWWQRLSWLKRICLIAAGLLYCSAGAILTFTEFLPASTGNVLEVLLRLVGVMLLVIGAAILAVAWYHLCVTCKVFEHPDEHTH